MFEEQRTLGNLIQAPSKTLEADMVRTVDFL